MSVSTQFPIETLETTGSVRRLEKVTGSHMFTIMGYSFDKDIGKGNFIESTIFGVGGHDWSIQYYPNGCTEAKDDDISIFLFLKSKSEGVRAQVSFTILNQNGCALPLLSRTAGIGSFNTAETNWGYISFAKRAIFESNIKDDCFVIKSVVTVFKAFLVEPTTQVIVPPSNILQQLGHLLDSANGTDVTFQVDGQILSAHRCILAVRSPVFSAQFFGPMKEKSDTIQIEEIEAPVFKTLLHFIYTDSFPGFEEIKETDEKEDTKLMAQHLLAAADRYSLERLKRICEKMLCGSINISNVISLLCLAERHNCNHLKATCLKFVVSSDSIGEVVATEEFQHLVKSHPLILKELLEKRG